MLSSGIAVRYIVWSFDLRTVAKNMFGCLLLTFFDVLKEAEAHSEWARHCFCLRLLNEDSSYIFLKFVIALIVGLLSCQCFTLLHASAKQARMARAISQQRGKETATSIDIFKCVVDASIRLDGLYLRAKFYLHA